MKPTIKEPPLGEGRNFGHLHDVVTRIHPKESWWSKYWDDNRKRWVRYKARRNYCRRCKRWGLGIEATCVTRENKT